jgi:hypothetical protein
VKRSVSPAARRFADQAQRPCRTRQDQPNPAFTAALTYTGRGWQVFPVTRNKLPLTEHGRSDATLDPDQIAAWWQRWPDALASIATGPESGIVALDIDVDDTVNGWDSLDAIGVSFAPETVLSHTPRGGTHALFLHPGHFVKTIAGKLGPGLDIRGDGGSLTLPPGPGRFWDPVLGLDTPIADMPGWMIIPEPVIEPARIEHIERRRVDLSRYAEVALDGAVNRIIRAGPGQQESTLNTEVFSIGRLAGGGVIPAGLAIEALLWAGRRMASHDPHRPWRPADIDKKVRLTLAAGLAKPRGMPA